MFEAKALPFGRVPEPAEAPGLLHHKTRTRSAHKIRRRPDFTIPRLYNQTNQPGVTFPLTAA